MRPTAITSVLSYAEAQKSKESFSLKVDFDTVCLATYAPKTSLSWTDTQTPTLRIHFRIVGRKGRNYYSATKG